MDEKMNKDNLISGCVTCGTSLGCFLPMTLLWLFGMVAAAINYFDSDYYWESFDTGMAIIVVVFLIISILVGLLQALTGAWVLSRLYKNSDQE